MAGKQIKPFQSRRTTYQVIVFAAPHSAEKTIMQIIAEYSIGFRPVISETRPFIGVSIVCARRYDYMSVLCHTIDDGKDNDVPSRSTSTPNARRSDRPRWSAELSR